MWEWLANLFMADPGLVTDAPAFLADPAFTLTGDAFTDVTGGAVGSGPTFADSAFSLDVPGIDGEALRPSVFDLSLGAAEPLGFLGAGGGLETLEGVPVRPTSFGGFNSNLGSGVSGALSDFIRNGTLSGLPSLGSSGGGTVNIAAPRIDTPNAPAVPMHQGPNAVPASPQLPPSPPVKFTPLASDVMPQRGAEPAMTPRQMASPFGGTDRRLGQDRLRSLLAALGDLT